MSRCKHVWRPVAWQQMDKQHDLWEAREWECSIADCNTIVYGRSKAMPYHEAATARKPHKTTPKSPPESLP